MISFRPLITLLAVTTATAIASFADETSQDNDRLIDQIIDKARSAIGSEEDLNKVKTLTFKGAILYGNGSTGSIEIVYKKPYYHRLASSVDNGLEVSGLDDSEAWLKSAPANAPNNWSLLILDADQVFNMRAKVTETLNFYARPKSRSGRVTYEGEEEIDGRPCHALLYYHGAGIWNLHYFDKETGRLAKTVNHKGIEFFERGEMMVDGIRFPKKVISVFYTAEGRGTMEMSYTSILVNKKYDNSIFEMPSVTE